MFRVMYRANGEACGLCGEDGTSVVWAGSVPTDAAEQFVAGLEESLSLEELQDRITTFLLELM